MSDFNTSEGPSKLLLSLEAIRGIGEYGLGWLLNIPVQSISPRGDGHPVLVIPGLSGADGSTHFLRNFIGEIGYAAQPWNLGRNYGPRNGLDKLLEQLYDRLKTIYDEGGGQQVSIVGWSLGGIYGRELAKVSPKMVRQVITLGTPFKPTAGGTNAEKLYEILSGDKSHKDPNTIAKISMPPPVPFTSLYSKTDGVVHWECSIEDNDGKSENIEIPGASHLGLGHNPIAMYLIANRLKQTRENWEPFTH